MDELLKELQALIDKYAEGTPEGVTEEEAKQDEERMAELTAEIERKTTEQAEQRKTRAAAVAAARSAIESGAAPKVSTVPLARSASAAGAVVRDTTDYDAAAKRGWLKDVATRAGVQLGGGNDMTPQERAAFTALTTNTDAVIPKEIQGQIISLVDNSAVLFGDVSRDNFKHQYELVRHTGIAQGDAAKTKEGEAPADEQNEFDTIALAGEEIKKTAKLSRKMAVQSMDGFEAWLIKEVAARIAVAANAFVHDRLTDAKLGIAAANLITCAKAGTLTKADITKMFGLLKTLAIPFRRAQLFTPTMTPFGTTLPWLRTRTAIATSLTRRPKTPPCKAASSESTLSRTIACLTALSALAIPILSKATSLTASTLPATSPPTARSAIASMATCSMIAALPSRRASRSLPSAAHPPK